MGARGTSYGTHHVKAYARRESSRAHRHPPGCNRVDDSSLAAFLKSAKQDKWKDTRRGIVVENPGQQISQFR
jgi:hypothetical protein